MELITIDDVRHAAKTIAGVAVRTPLLPCWWDDQLLLKPESLQPTGAFKLRGAYNALAALPAERRAAGVVANSSGNHAQGLAYAARSFGVPCVVVMPDVAVSRKVEATRALGAEVVLVPRAERFSRVREIAAQRGMSVVPPFDHRDVIAGQGTIGLEILEDVPDVDVVLVPVGGGGLASGVATAVKALRPSAAVIGVEPEFAATGRDCLAAGEVVVWSDEDTYRTSADGLRASPSPLTLAHMSALLDGIVTVTEEQIASMTEWLAREARLLVEPSGAVAAAARHYRGDALPDGRTVAVISGGYAA